ncbi:MAG: DUF6992 family protein [Chitinophagales bacterium]
MKNRYYFILPLFFCLSLQAQHTFNDSIAMSRNKITKNAMIVLGSWAAINITSGFIAASQTTGETKYFWQMNAYWNLVNGGLAILGYINAHKAMTRKFDFSDNVAAQGSMVKLYAFNFGLDLAYIASGFFLREKGTNETNAKSQDQLNGYGTSLIIQGGFLLLMDGIVLSLHHKNTLRVNNKLKSLGLVATPNGLGLAYVF